MRLIKISGMLALLIIISISCKTKKGSSDNGTTDTQDKVVTDIQISEALMLPKKIDPVTINSLHMEEGSDVIEIDVSYGGCKLHDFVLYGNHSYQKSLPPKIGLALIHDAHGDKCKKQTTEKLYFNIKDIRVPDHKEDYIVVVYVNQSVGKSVDYKY
ncbi:MAG: hypothetical protein JKY54_11625 [Flavobacteriales bacterium]|nr:hypothetical protein [Flavobacteriales bacterium]